jgi:hypothetical protein
MFTISLLNLPLKSQKLMVNRKILKGIKINFEKIPPGTP